MSRSPADFFLELSDDLAHRAVRASIRILNSWEPPSWEDFLAVSDLLNGLDSLPGYRQAWSGLTRSQRQFIRCARYKGWCLRRAAGLRLPIDLDPHRIKRPTVWPPGTSEE